MPGVKHVFVQSGIRMDVALRTPTYLRELVRHHVSGHLKVAPEHLDPSVLRRMRKPAGVFEPFLEAFRRESAAAGKEQYLVPYFISSFPGCTQEQMRVVEDYLRDHPLEPAAGPGLHPAADDAGRRHVRDRDSTTRRASRSPWRGAPANDSGSGRPSGRRRGSVRLGLHGMLRSAPAISNAWQLYRDLLGLREVSRHHEPCGRLRSIWLDLGGPVLMIEQTGEPSRPVLGVGAGFFLIALAAGPADRVVHERTLAMAGFPVESRTEHTIYLRDPEGNRVALSGYPLGGRIANDQRVLLVQDCYLVFIF